jgi:hypothetical protein
MILKMAATASYGSADFDGARIYNDLRAKLMETSSMHVQGLAADSLHTPFLRSITESHQLELEDSDS